MGLIAGVLMGAILPVSLGPLIPVLMAMAGTGCGVYAARRTSRRECADMGRWFAVMGGEASVLPRDTGPLQGL